MKSIFPNQPQCCYPLRPLLEAEKSLVLKTTIQRIVLIEYSKGVKSEVKSHSNRNADLR